MRLLCGFLAVCIAFVSGLWAADNDCVQRTAALYRIAPTDDMRVVALCKDGTQWRASIRAPLAHVCDGHYGVGFMTGAHQ